MYKVKFSDNAIKCLKKLDKQIAEMIISWILKNLEGTTNPRQFGKALVGNKKGIWRYRIGDYRVLVHIYDDELLVLVLDSGHRKNIY